MRPPQPAPGPRTIQTLAPRLAPLLHALATLITYRLPRHPIFARLVAPLHAYLRNLARRLAATLIRIAAGRPTRPTKRASTPRKPRLYFPAGKGWLIRAIPNEAAIFRGYIETLLAEPEIAALLAEIPRVASLLAPLRRALSDEQPKTRRKPTPYLLTPAQPSSPPTPIPINLLFPGGLPKIEA